MLFSSFRILQRGRWNPNINPFLLRSPDLGIPVTKPVKFILSNPNALASRPVRGEFRYLSEEKSQRIDKLRRTPAFYGIFLCRECSFFITLCVKQYGLMKNYTTYCDFFKFLPKTFQNVFLNATISDG